jgi:hypothetical protein
MNYNYCAILFPFFKLCAGIFHKKDEAHGVMHFLFCIFVGS